MGCGFQGGGAARTLLSWVPQTQGPGGREGGTPHRLGVAGGGTSDRADVYDWELRWRCREKRVSCARIKTWPGR